MLGFTVIYVGDSKLKEDYFLEAEKEYIKRLKPFCDYNTVAVKEERLPEDEGNTVMVERALNSEADRIRLKIPKRCFKIALCVEGKKMTSESFATMLGEKTAEFSDIVFIIGSSHGLDGKLKKECDLLLSFSDMTFPHRFMRPILAEQVYRAYTIITGKKYHK